MRYRLRTLLIVLAVGPPMLAYAWHFFNPPPGTIRFHGDNRIEGRPDSPLPFTIRDLIR